MLTAVAPFHPHLRRAMQHQRDGSEELKTKKNQNENKK